jgi:hypothetical protein
MRVKFYAKGGEDLVPSPCEIKVFSDQIWAITPMPLNQLIDRMHGSLVCLAAREGPHPPQRNHLRPLIDGDGEPVPIVARQPTLQGLLDAIAEDECSPDW